MKYNAIVGQSGGPTSVINASLAGVIDASLSSDEIGLLYGMFNGIDGILNENIINLTEKFENNISDLNLLKITPAAALGSCRHRLPKDIDSDSEGLYKKIFDFFKKYNIGYFFYIGGNDSMDTVEKLSRFSKYYDADFIRFIGIPKTIDNDICETDHTPGFGSAAKYIASTVQDILYDCAVYTVKSVTVIEIMGRDAGWLTAAAAVPRLNGISPDYIYLPEVPFDVNDFITDIENAHKFHPNVVIAISEGVRYKDGRYVGESCQSGASDVFGHKYLAGVGKTLENVVKQQIGCKVRSIELSLPQRCSSVALSLTDVNESFDVGKFAVKAAEQGNSGVIITCVRGGNDPYSLFFGISAISNVANRVKRVPNEYISNSGNNVTDECVKYILPLISGEPEIEYKNGIPVHFHF